MKYKNFQIFFLMLLMAASTLAGDKIKLKLTQPPPNKMPVTSLWKMDIENTTREAITIYLSGTASGERQGDIVGGTTKPFSVKPGKSTYGYDDFKSGDVKWSNKSIQEIIFRTGDVPEDNYTICVTAYYENGSVADNQQCITHLVGPTGEGTISLVAPENEYVLQVTGNVDKGGGVDEEQMAALNNLMWTSLSIPQDGFSIKFVEMKSGQLPEEAINSNITFFKQDGIRTNTLKYPTSAPRFKIGKKYAWQVSSGNAKSDVWIFSIKSSEFMSSVVFKKLVCTNTPGKYEFELEVKVTEATYSQFKINAGDINITFSQPAATWTKSITDPPFWPLTFSSPYPVTKSIKGTITSSPAITLNELEFKVTLHYTSSNGTAATKDHLVDTTATNNCNVNCCDGFVKRITQSLDKESKILSFSLQAGPKKIRKVTMDLVYVNAVPSDNNCPVCKNNWMYWGNFFCWSCSLAGFGAVNSPETHWRELVWGSDGGAGVDMMTTPRSGSTNTLLDHYSPSYFTACCKSTVEYCIRYSFTDTTCVTCDTVICSSITFGGSSDTTLQRYDDIEKQMKMQGEFNELRKRDLQEEQIKEYGFGQGEKNENEKVHSGLESSLKTSNIPPSNVMVTITSDNSYAFGFGNHDNISDYRPGVTNDSPNKIYGYNNNGEPGEGPEIYPIIADMNSYIYIIAWSDNKHYQGVIAQFTDGIKTIKTKPLLPGGINWEVYATGEGSSYPNVSSVNSQIALANSNNGWVNSSSSGPNGRLHFGPNNEAPLGGILENHAIVSNIDADAQWMWFNPIPLTITYPFSYDWSPSGTGFVPALTNMKEYYIFRVGPIGQFFQPDCCENFRTTVTSETTAPSGLKVKFSSNHKIRRIIADIVDFKLTYNNDACKTCVSDSKLWGNFKSPITAITGLSNPRLTFPGGLGTVNMVSREITWGTINGPAIDMTNPTQWLQLQFSVPPKHTSTCCADTIKYCVKYKFYDEACVQCDTTICYTIVRRATTSQGFNGNEELRNNEMETGQIQGTDQSIESNGYQGQTAGMVNVDLDKSSDVKIIVYDNSGKEIMQLFDDYMKEGKYAFDLNSYKLPDGVYFYKLINGDDIKYNKVLIANGCSCGKK